MIKTDKDVGTYLASLPAKVKNDVLLLDKEITKIMKGRSRTLWEGVFWGGSQQAIIGYGDSTYKRPGKKDTDWFVVGLALQKNYISAYINAVENGKYIVETHKDELGKAKVGKSSIGFKKVSDINLGELLHLVEIAKNQPAPDFSK